MKILNLIIVSIVCYLHNVTPTPILGNVIEPDAEVELILKRTKRSIHLHAEDQHEIHINVSAF